MIQVCRLTKRQVEPDKKPKLEPKLEQVKVFSLNVGHGVGSIDFIEKIDEIEDDEYDAMIDECGEYAKFKLGNLTRYFELEVYPEHIVKLVEQMPDCRLRKHFMDIKEGYFVIRKTV